VWNRTVKTRNPETGRKVSKARPKDEWERIDVPKLRIVPEELWNGVQARIAHVNGTQGAARLGGMNRTVASRAYLFSGLLVCAECRSRPVIISGRGKRGYVKYGCPSHRYRGVCDNAVTIRQDRLEKQLLDALEQRLAGGRRAHRGRLVRGRRDAGGHLAVPGCSACEGASMNLMFFALSTAGYGETVIGLSLARQLEPLGVRSHFVISPVSEQVLKRTGIPFTTIEPRMGRLVRLLVDEDVRQFRPDAIVLADYYTYTGVFRERFGLDSWFIEEYGVPILPIDIWEWDKTSCAVDMFEEDRPTDKKILDMDVFLRPVPLAHPEQAAIVSSPRIFNDLTAPLCHGGSVADRAAVAEARARGAFVFPMHEPEGYEAANDAVLAAARESDGLLVPFCRVNPHDDALREAERCVDAGARGIKLHPRAEQFTLDHPAVKQLAALANERRLPILIHAGRGIPALGLHAVQPAGEFPDCPLSTSDAADDLLWLDLGGRRIIKKKKTAVISRFIQPVL